MSQSVLIQAVVYLAAAVVCVPIAKRLGLGSVLGYLLAGVLIGPAGLELIGTEGQDVMHYAEFGVVIMLFLIGLELEPELLWRMRTAILGLGGFQVLLTMLGGMGLAMLAGLAWQPALATGMILAMSSTAIVLQMLKEKGLTESSAGRSAFAVLLFQDIAVIPILAVMPLLQIYPIVATGAEGHHSLVEHLPGLLRVLVVVGSVGGVVALGRFGMRPIFRVIAGTGLREVFIATALLLVVGVALLMELVGLSPALGAFVAGVVLANSEYKRELESDIDPFRGLLLGLFFIAVGTSIDIALIAANVGVVMGIVLTIMVLKAAVLWGLGGRFKLGTDQNLIFSLALCQVGEFAFVLLSFAQQNGILATDTVGLLTASVALTMALTPVLMLVNERWLLPRLGTRDKPGRTEDAVEEKNPVIIAGFGPFGNTVGRFLRANNVGTTVLDMDSDRVDLLRKIGLKVYYGDASRYDLLRAAGADDARLIVVALDTTEQSVELVETVRKHFPHLQILARAMDWSDAYELVDAQVPHTRVYRETLDTSVRMGVDVLRELGVRAYHAQRAAHLFIKQDLTHLDELARVRHDEKLYFNTTRRQLREIEQLMEFNEKNRWLKEINDGWDTETLRAEVKSIK
ncbi:potassium transporter [Rudanella paleaurantiibacter]|uniref:Potassium transporter n=1 Tax=Rudanella paleaurantiibacter TaxID=2614655 RepID=A0A7J5U0I1_9BACT|nr:monovalent cation:proton antiporter-2 (CPA2) family protein [Rudanella paleaurantiibacter]KAB7731262.1 potassium transporter [Rudanella paleaurantiibacter]